MTTQDWQLDWDAAFDNMQSRDPQALMANWQDRSDDFKSRWAGLGQGLKNVPYGDHPRQRYDMFTPKTEAKGTIIFIHGGYWMRTGREHWSFLAEGMLAHGWAVAIPSYPLAPEVKISAITTSIVEAANHIASQTTGALRLIGHSAGGHLVSRLACQGMLSDPVLARIEKAISVSGIHDLRPLLMTKMNDILNLDLTEASAESSALFTPEHIPFTCWVGDHERPEFLRQNRLLQDTWRDYFDAPHQVNAVYDQGHDHFSVIEQLAKPDCRLTLAIGA